MFNFLKKDPIEKAKKHVEKALREIEEEYFDYASVEYEKAAMLFIEAGSTDFAVKYFREAAYCALEDDNHLRAAEMKVLAAETYLSDQLYDEAGGFYQEASDHFFKDKKINESLRALALSALSHLAARSFDTSTNLLRKMEKRMPAKNPPKIPACDVAREYIGVLIEGRETTQDALTKCISKFKPKEAEQELFEFLTNSVRLAVDTVVRIEWAGKSLEEVSAKSPIEFELIFKCPVPVRVIDYKLTLSNSLTFINEPKITNEEATEGSYLLTLNPVLSGEGVVGPFKLTLSGERMLAHKHSNQIKFRIAKAPSQIGVEVTPRKISCGIGDEVVFDLTLTNSGEGPADNVKLTIELSDGIQLSLGSTERIIQFIGPNENMRLQLYVRGISMGSHIMTVKLADPRSGTEVSEEVLIEVG